MRNSQRYSARRAATIMATGLLLAVAVAVLATAKAKADFYDVVFCAAGNGSGNPTPGARPGFFDWRADCGQPASYPADSNSFLRLNENTTGTAGQNDEVSLSWHAPSGTSIVAGGGYTRMPNAFNAGWRARFWGEDWGGGVHNVLLQGAGVENGDGITKNTTSTFASHLWPFGGWDDYRRFVFGLACVRPAGCDRSNFNAVDAHSITLVADDRRDPETSFVDGETVRGEWVRGIKVLSWRESDQGSGLRYSRLKVDDATLGDGLIDYQANGGCRTGRRDGGREVAKALDPCTRGPYQRWRDFDTRGFSDGAHALALCLQDYGQYRSGRETCDRRTIRTDNAAPGKPAGLRVTSANPERYLPRFGAAFSLPPNQGSPITKVHYEIAGADGKVLVPEKTLSGTDPTSLAGIEGPADPGAYTLRVWLEDAVGHKGQAAEAPIPRDTTPPAAPQELRVAGPGGRWLERVDLRWRNVADAGSAIEEARYRVLDGAGMVVSPVRALRGAGPQALEGLATPERRGRYEAQVWLVDGEGNVGAAAAVPLPLDTTPPAAPQEVSLAAPGASRGSEGFDLRWRNLTDTGSAIGAAHYAVLDGSGKVVVSERTVAGRDVEAIADLDAPDRRGAHTLRLWLSDEEGNVGAPVSVPLAYRCVRSQAGAASSLSAATGRRGRPRVIVGQGRGAILRGRLADRGASGPADSPLCVFARVATDSVDRFLGISLTGAGGRYRFAVPAGPSRELTVAHRDGHREIAASAWVLTRVRPSFRVRRRVVRNKRFARFRACVPGPRNAGVLLTLQVKRGDGWLAFRRYRTRPNGCATIVYRFTRTDRPTLYPMRAEVRKQSGFPYETGISKPLRLIVLPARGAGDR